VRATAPRLAVRALHATGARFADEPGSAGGLTLNFALPSKSLYTEAMVEMVILPGGDGMFGVMANHVPTITELKPGIVSVQESVGGPLTKYFVAGGFASVNSDSVLNLTALEAVTIDELDPEAVKLGLAQYSAAYAAATEDYAKSEAEIGVEVYQAMSYAIAEP
jgi:F-type H+-transporting ATPase subunit delta